MKNGDQVTIVTVYSGTRKRAVDAQNYAASIGASWVGWGFDEGDEFTKLEFRDKLNPMYDDEIAIYIPFGIQNDEHQRVKRAFNEAEDHSIWNYWSQTIRERITEETRNASPDNRCNGNVDKVAEIDEQLSKIEIPADPVEKPKPKRQTKTVK